MTMSRHEMSAVMNQAQNRAIALEEAVERVKELHDKIQGPYDNYVCSHCTIDEYIYAEYPCPTIEALEGNHA